MSDHDVPTKKANNMLLEGTWLIKPGIFLQKRAFLDCPEDHLRAGSEPSAARCLFLF